MTVLEFRGVTKEYRIRGSKKFKAVDDVSFILEPGKTIALVGQSGSGKSTIAKILLQLEAPTSGSILLDGKSVPRHGAGLRRYRKEVQMVFQDPFASLNPFHTVSHHLARPLQLHGQIGSDGVNAEVVRLLERVQLEPAALIAERRPHELSGGQRQRVAIARALAPRPSVLIADEPVSMLDVSIRLGVLNLLGKLQREEDLGVLYITHDLATARHFSDEIIVLNKGKIVEQGPSDRVILDPQHDYTKALLAASPNPELRFAH
ncbi:ABC transporter ATP-binding protein [Cryobacterium frigoriphilum]|uniref:ABC transporter ATP-binding protein n=1 Tax=Cryobacterium frigoriphilum TaxID=1259150 RepID=A0A4R9A222_9MICO|nr:ATP-binding cassette domain-containing protein [Cryobacterium frigoriphilum]TFD50243.1 ABC transporter ATP-binding protein [Cryobacterium frigoriphilum]